MLPAARGYDKAFCCGHVGLLPCVKVIVGNSWVFLPKASAMSRSAYWRVSVIAMNGLAFDVSTRHGRTMATIGIADFERELLQERATLKTSP